MPWSKQMPARPVVAVAGVTGAVGREMLLTLEQRGFPAAEVRALASARSAGKRVPFAGGELVVEEMTDSSFDGVDIALFSAGAGVSKRFRDAVTGAGCVMIDNSSAFRMEDDVPLVVPEVNAEDVAWNSGVIANPNCSTIQMVVALKPLHDLSRIKRVVVATYQAASGAGQAAMDELYEQSRQFLSGEDLTVEQFAHRIAFNCIPQIDVFLDDGSTKEEWKMVVETKKIMHAPEIAGRPRRAYACRCCAATRSRSTWSSTGRSRSRTRGLRLPRRRVSRCSTTPLRSSTRCQRCSRAPTTPTSGGCGWTRQ